MVPFIPHFYDISRRRQWQPTPVLLPGKSHGQRSLVGCSLWGRWESDTTEQLHFHLWMWLLARLLSPLLIPPSSPATAKSLQSCLTLCNPIDGSPPGSPSLGYFRQEHWSGLPFPSPFKFIPTFIKNPRFSFHVLLLLCLTSFFNKNCVGV